MKLENGYYIDDNNNSWNSLFYTEDQAGKHGISLINCRNCRNCRNCSDCSDCSGCSYCSYCSDCSGCSDCSDFKNNPERIVSGNIGSRHSQTTVYFNSEKILVICGCFKGTIEEFKQQIKSKHGNNEHAKNYFEWLKRVETYMQSL